MSEHEGVSQDMILGELRGQVRELIHSVNNLSMNVTSLGREVSALGTLASTLSDVQARLAVIEAKQNQSDGEKGAWAALMKSPLLAWLFSLAAAAYVFLREK